MLRLGGLPPAPPCLAIDPVQVAITVPERCLELRVARPDAHGVGEGLSSHPPLRFSDGRQGRPVIRDDKVCRDRRLFRERTLETEDSESQAPASQQVVLTPRFIKVLELLGRHGGSTPSREGRDPHLVAGDGECDQQQYCSQERPAWAGDLPRNSPRRRRTSARSVCRR